MKKAYEITVIITTSRPMTVHAANRQEAIEKASKISRKRYGENFTGTLSVPYLEGDE